MESSNVFSTVNKSHIRVPAAKPWSKLVLVLIVPRCFDGSLCCLSSLSDLMCNANAGQVV